jgi:DNA modification methylase
MMTKPVRSRTRTSNVRATAVSEMPPPIRNWSPDDPPVRYRLVATSSLTPPDRQLKQHSDKHVMQIAASISQFGNLTAIVVDENLKIVAGVGRYLAAKSLNLETVPVVQVEHLSSEDLRAYAIADNKLCELAPFDPEVLGLEFNDLSNCDLGFDLQITGFEAAEIDGLISPAAAKDDEAPPPAPNKREGSCIRIGDLFRLGDHKLICGNSLEAETYDGLMALELARVVVSDNPYNIQIENNVSGRATGHKDFLMASGEMSKPEFTHFLTTVFGHLARFSVNGSIHYQFIDHRHLREMLDAGEAAYTEMKNLCVWDKQVGALGSCYRNQHELCFVWKSGTDPYVNNFKLGETGRYRTNVWSYPGIAALGPRKREELAMHPTCKNLQMICDMLLDVSGRREFVLDPFSGSGTTIIAAERTGRRARAIELDPIYVAVAIRRWERLTGRAAIHATLGCTFDELVDLRSELQSEKAA